MLHTPKALILIGLRASGKSTLARALAAAQQLPCADLDHLTAAELGHDSVRAAWAAVGEPAFRIAETRALARALETPGDLVLALGGGTPTAPGAAELLRAARDAGHAVIVYLRCTPDELRRRLAAAGPAALADRPSLTGAAPLDEIESVFRARDSLYSSLASRTLEGIDSQQRGLIELSPWKEWTSPGPHAASE
ncbi:MAG: shikimate kinase [Planctomycetota bacterium]|nr:shikimate kinase [Planctomycetota bacterium]